MAMQLRGRYHAASMRSLRSGRAGMPVLRRNCNNRLGSKRELPSSDLMSAPAGRGHRLPRASRTHPASSKGIFPGSRNDLWFPNLVCTSQLKPSHGDPNPVPKENDQIKLTDRVDAPATRLPAWPELWLRPADRLDYAIRRWVIPISPEVNRSVTATRGVSRSTSRRDASRKKELSLTEIQAAIGRYLRAEYDLAQPIPARLADLLRQLEQPNSRSEGVA